MRLRGSEVAAWSGGELVGEDVEVEGASTDSRELLPGQLFVPLVAERDGSISAEHGIGHAKKPWLHLVRTPEELAAMRAIKAALDPAGILNPNELLP